MRTSTSQICARPSSAAKPFSPTLLFEPDADVDEPPIRARDEVLGPMMINPPCGQLGQERPRFVDMSLAGVVVISANCVGICNEELITDC